MKEHYCVDCRQPSVAACFQLNHTVQPYDWDTEGWIKLLRDRNKALEARVEALTQAFIQVTRKLSR